MHKYKYKQQIYLIYTNCMNTKDNKLFIKVPIDIHACVCMGKICI
jgi:hypothetical protein